MTDCREAATGPVKSRLFCLQKQDLSKNDKGSKNMKYEEALEYLDQKVNPIGSVLGLDTIRELLKRIGNPEKDLRIIHVAGTNGKGSVSSFLAGALTENGYRVGRYISPSVVDYREKIQVNGSFIPKSKVAEYLTMLFETARQMKEDGFAHPTSFEIETAMAFWYLRDKKCDFNIVEVGMGGAEDATNVIPSPELCVICSVSLDHVGMIGNTLEEIAATKAGIIKDNTKVVVAPQKESVRDVIRERCNAMKNVHSFFVKREDIIVKTAGKTGTGNSLPRKLTQKFSYKNYKNAEISMLGAYQPENAAVALEALDVLQSFGVKLKEEKIRQGLLHTVWPGRFEILGRNPLVIADGAHNPDAVSKLMETIDNYFTNQPIIYIMGVLKDKAVEEIVALSAAKADYIITITTPNNKRTMQAFDLAQIIREYNPNVSAADSVEEALEEACLVGKKEGVILAFGSLSYMGVLREAYVKICKIR